MSDKTSSQAVKLYCRLLALHRGLKWQATYKKTEDRYAGIYIKHFFVEATLEAEVKEQSKLCQFDTGPLQL